MEMSPSGVAFGALPRDLGGTMWIGKEDTVFQPRCRPSSALDYDGAHRAYQSLRVRNIDTCSNNGYDYVGCVYSRRRFHRQEFRRRVQARRPRVGQGPRGAGDLIGGGSRGCKTPWSGPVGRNHGEPGVQAVAEGATGRIYLRVMKGPGSIERHGGYEDVYVKTAIGWRIKSRTHVRDQRLVQTRCCRHTDLN